MKTQKEWEDQAKGLLKAELKRRSISYADLAKKLREIGVEESEPNVRNKLSRGKFTFVFFLQCMSVIGTKTLHVAD